MACRDTMPPCMVFIGIFLALKCLGMPDAVATARSGSRPCLSPAPIH